jgi:hypothetical protein
MKKTDLEKQKALKIMGKLNAGIAPGRFGGSAPVPDRREQRRLDQAAGLVSFPVKLQQPIIAALRSKAETEGVNVNELINTLLADALGLKG